MGITASSQQTPEGEHFSFLINPSKVKEPQKSQNNAGAVLINNRAKVLKVLSFEKLWENFLNGSSASFALTQAEATSLIIDSIPEQDIDGTKFDRSNVETDVKEYITLIEELSSGDLLKTIDFMSLCSSVLFLSEISIETKADQLFSWIALDPESSAFSFDDFFVAMRSFERGLSHAMGRTACTEGFVKGVATQWMALADPQKKGSTDAQTRVSNNHFFDFCTNRQHVVRRLLEALASVPVQENENAGAKEVTDTVGVSLSKGPSGGDEWMANPAWKKTAERMVPAAVKAANNSSKPASSLELEWVHGYRGFDCRNNITYVNKTGSQVAFSAAALGIVQDNSTQNACGRTQSYFGEHGDDVLSLVTLTLPSGKTFVASGEIGKKPAIYLYSWQPGTGSQGGFFTSLCCMSGYHTKGVTQLVFSADGKVLFSVGADYTVAVYNTEEGHKSFGKMITSSQGPKSSKVLHAALYGVASGSSNAFITCGEKHAVTWQLEKGSLKQTECKLATYRNKIMLSVAYLTGGMAVLASAEGDLVVVANDKVVPAVLQGCTGHGKKAINAIWSSPNGDVLVTGDRGGKVITWRVEATSSKDGSTATLTSCAEFEISGFATSIAVEGGLNMASNVTTGTAVATKTTKGGPPKGKGPAPKAAAPAPAQAFKKGPAADTEGAVQEHDLAPAGSVPSIRAVALSEDFTRMLVGTQTCEILEYVLPNHQSFADPGAAAVKSSAISSAQVVGGHFKDEVWGLAVRPRIAGAGDNADAEYCTVGDDGYLRVWSLQQHKQVCCVELPGMARACDYSPDGNYLAVGFGGRVGKTSAPGLDGLVKVFRFNRSSSDKPGSAFTLTQVGEIKDAKQWISVVRFSPDGSTLAVGSRDNSIYLYSVMHQYTRKGKFSKHNSGINQLDFTLDGKYLQSNCSSYEILFSDANTGAQITDGATRLLDAQWASWTCTLGWPVIGTWSGSMDGTDINAVHRSHSGRLLATADDFGKVNVFRFPAVKEGGAEHDKYCGHSSHVTGVRWVSLGTDRAGVPSDDYLLSIGGEDKCVFQWRNRDSEVDAKPSLVKQSGTSSGGLSSSEVHLEGMDEFSAPSGGDEFTAVKPWLGAIVAPTAWAKPDPSKADPFFAALGEMSTSHRRLIDEGKMLGTPGEKVPSVYEDVQRSALNVLKKMSESGVTNNSAPDADELELDWVHGYRGFDCRNNVFYVESKVPKKDGSVSRSALFYAAGLGILQDPTTRTQQYFRGHTDDVVSMAVHKGESCEATADAIVATGQQGIGSIFVWEVPSMKTLAVLKTKQKNVNMLEFSQDGRKLFAISEDNQVAVCDWKSQTLLSITKGEPAPTMHLAAGPTTNGNYTFLSCGDKHIRIWTLSGRNLTAAKVVTSGCQGAKIQMYLCAAEVHGKYLVGCDDGSIYVIPCGGKGVTGLFEHHTSEAKAKLVKNGASITSIHVQSSNAGGSCLLLTGSKNGTVVVWDASELKSKDRPVRRFTLDVSALEVQGLVAKQIQATYVLSEPKASSADEITVLVATRGCDLLEVRCNLGAGTAALFRGSGGKDLTNGILVQAHCNDELWGVATHPSKPEYCTVGDDKTLRFYNVHSRQMITSVPLGIMARTCDYSPTGDLLAVGFGGRVGRGKEKGGGALRLYSADPHASKGIQKLDERTDAKEWISDVKFSADGTTLAVGAHDCKIYIYAVEMGSGGSAKLKLRSTFAKHNSVINHLDLSADGRFMQSNCSAYELLFCDTTTGKQITSATELRDVKWSTWTCTLGWPVQGIWAAGMDGSDINAVARSHSGHLLATSDDLGKVNLFRYPAVQSGAGSVSYAAHSSHVMNVRWTAADECLLSCGGNDKCLMQWRHTMTSSGGGGSSRSSGVARSDSADEEEFLAAAAGGSSAGAGAGAAAFDFGGGPSGGDEAGAVKPWLGAVRAPKNPPPVSPAAPNAHLELEWVNGYTSASAGAKNTKISSNLFYNANNCPVYPAAAVAVQLHCGDSTSEKGGRSGGKDEAVSRATFKQSFFQGHNDDILCLSISKDRRFIATGQTASKTSKGKGSVIVWDAVQSRLLCRMDGCHQRAVCSLAFNPEGNQLVSVGQDDSNTHILWEDQGGGWSKAQQLATSKGDKAPVLFSRWVHTNNPMAKTAEYHFLSGGADGVNFWKSQGSALSKKQGRFTKKYKASPLLCAANIQGKDSWRMVLGTATGDLYIYDEREVCDGVEGAHKGPVLCLAEGGEDCTFLVSGGRDHLVKVWNQAMQPISVFDVSPFSVVDGSVASLDVRPVDTRNPSALALLLGTYGGEIIELSAEKGGSHGNKKGGDAGGSGEQRNLDLSHSTADVLLHSHYSGELWGLAPHPLDPDVYATVGDDKTLRIWSIRGNCLLKAQPLYWPARCVAWHPLGTALAVGFHESTKGGYKAAAKGKGAAAAAPAAAKGKSTVPKNAAKRNSAAVEEDEDGGGDNIYESSSAGGADTTHKGAIHLYSFHKPSNDRIEIKKRADGCTSLAWINDIKFSPDGRILLAGSHDKRLYAFDIPELSSGDASNDAIWEPWAKCLNKAKYEFNKHSSAVLHVDFTLDGKYFQTNCQAAELLFGAVDTGRQETSATKLADYNGQLEDDPELEGRQWATQTCKLGWTVQGIWPPGADTTDINSVDRSADGKLLATADDFGCVKLFRFPCAQDASKFLSYGGHSSHVTNVRWTTSNQLLSVGGNDKCVFVWSMSEK